MRRLFIAAFAFMIAGLASGVFFREFTKALDFPEGAPTMLGGVHTHLLALGVLVPLIAMALEKLFTLTASPRLFAWFFWTYVSGVTLTAVMMLWHGTLTVVGAEAGAAIAGIAGLGHILLATGFVLFFLTLGRALRRDREAVAAS